MKIIPPIESGKVDAVAKSKTAEKRAGAEFGDMLKEAMAEKNVHQQEKTGVMKTILSGTVPPIQGADVHQADMIDRIEGLLNLLEEYKCRLEDGRCSLKQIQPLIEEMKLQGEKLGHTAENTGKPDGLKGLAHQTLDSVKMEIIKFDSGRYIDP